MRVLGFSFTFLCLLISGRMLGTDSDTAVVKVYSWPESSPNRVFKGSGTLFSYEQEVLVVTSEHVLFHSDSSEYLHEISSEEFDFTRLATSLVRVDYGSGIALLRVDRKHPLWSHAEKVAIPLSRFAEFTRKNPSPPADSLTTVGYPTVESNLFRGHDSKLISSRSVHHAIPQAREMVVIQNSYGDFGMSGGALFNGDGQYLGMLTHLGLVPRKGQRSLIVVSQEAPEPSFETVLALPAKVILPWLEETLELQWDSSRDMRRKPEGQLSGKELVIWHGLEFEELDSDAAEDSDSQIISELEVQISDLKAAAVGGQDGVGVGGQDGVGVGGKEYKIEDKRLIPKSASKLARSAFLVRCSECDVTVPAQLSSIRESVLARKEVMVTSLLKLNDKTGFPTLVRFESLGQGLKLISEGLVPAGKVSAKFDPDRQSLVELQKKILVEAALMRRNLETLKRSTVKSKLEPATNEQIAELEKILKFIAMNRYDLVSSNWIDWLLDEHSTEWSELLSKHPKQAQELLRILYSFRYNLDKLRI